ncbi:MAG: S-layer homology domain-containing protein, partial [Clostridia bacterium]|nr:S-layer homology domain-containing protein [Clostridia bacterium]
MKRKIISLVLALVLLVSAMPAALAVEGSFTDITDKDVAQAAETLRLLGVVDGVGGGKFEPAKNLTRAQFCKMAIVMMGIEAQEPGYRSRTIFTDVASTHWARGYINLAASGENAFISGMGNGIFAPDEDITFAQAVTILVRLLGYSDSDTSMQWPEGYLTLADGIGLTEGFNLGANAAVSRAEAAQLFEKMLLCDTKAGTVYLSRFGSVTEKVIMLSNDAVAADGSLGAVYTSAGTFKTDVAVADSYIGERGTVVVKEGKLVVFIPTDTTKVTVSAATVEAGWFKDSNGVRHTVPSATVVYTDSEKTTWNDVWLDMPMGSNLTLYFDAKGNVETVFYATSNADDIAVAMSEVSGNPFVSLLDGATEYTIYKNGAAASTADIRRYDVAEYDKAAKQLRINDVKLTGRYENAYPSEASPEQIKLLGKTWKVLPAAQESLANFKIGDTV